jgi:hypothetical protein
MYVKQRIEVGRYQQVLVLYLERPPDNSALTIYVQNGSPSPDKHDNWLPAPKDDFSLYIRAYWPKEEITEGKWGPPRIERSK